MPPLLLLQAEAKVMAAQACILDLQEQLQAALLRPPQHPADSRQPDTPSGEGVQVAVLEQQLLAVQQELAQAETAHMSRTLSDELGLSATQAQALRVSTLQASLERERSTSKHQVGSHDQSCCGGCCECMGMPAMLAGGHA